jgi:CheY-like chemotaxis protein
VPWPASSARYVAWDGDPFLTAKRFFVAKILAIDDDPDFIEFIRIILEAEGHSVICAYNVDQALALMRQEHPDLVLLDLLISYAMQGLDVKRAMGADPELRDIPLIVISSVLTDADALLEEEVPPTLAVLNKPVEPDVLLRLIHDGISKRTCSP